MLCKPHKNKNMLPLLLNPLAVIMSFSTATGILIHDMHIDTAASTAFSMPSMTASYEANNKYMNLDGAAHAHVERGSLSQAIIDLKMQNPRIQPRVAEDKKYLLQKRVMRGHHMFDNYNLPIVD